MGTFFQTVEKAQSTRNWVLVDAADKVVGRLASEVAGLLRGKHKAEYTPHVDTGDFVVIINAAKIKFTGGKDGKKIYYKHTEYVGGMKKRTAGQMLATKPEEVIKLAVAGMLPKSALGKQQISKLKIYPSAEHPHQAQQPKTNQQ
jgi:large subunit ribosomal protein L13